jgi:membrane-associated phospholipid phosphatase
MASERYPGLKPIKYRNILVFVGLSYLIAAGVFASHSQLYTSTQINLFLAINKDLSVSPAFWLDVTAFGNIAVLLPMLSVFVLKNARIWAALFGAIPPASIMTHLGKRFFAVPRPAAVIDSNQFETAGAILRGYTSFPSGHTIAVFAVTTVILCVLIYEERMQRPLLWAGLLAFCATLVGISRITVGAHWPLDVLTGAVLGVIAGLIGVYLTYRYKTWWHWAKNPRWVFVDILLLALFVYTDIKRVEYAATYWLAIVVAVLVMGRLLIVLYDKSWRHE